MTVNGILGFEANSVTIDGGSSIVGTASYDTGTVRTGARSLRCNPASGATGRLTYNAISNGRFVHFAIRVATLPSANRAMIGAAFAGGIHLELRSDGKISVFQNTTLIGTSTTALSTGTWYWIGFRTLTGTSVSFLQIDGLDEVTGTVTVTTMANVGVGFCASEASAVDAYFDDVIVNDTGFIEASNVGLLLPISDNARSAGWVGGGGSTTSLFAAVDNTPPVGVADTGTNTSQIRNATAEANGSYDANMTTYATAGVGASDTVLAVQPVIATAAPVTNSAKQGTVGVVSNPAITNVALGAGGTAGAFWAGVAGGTYPTGWKVSFGTMTEGPSVTVGTSPVMRVTQVTSSTRIAMVCFMGMMVAWTPAAVAASIPSLNPYPALLAQ